MDSDLFGKTLHLPLILLVTSLHTIQLDPSAAKLVCYHSCPKFQGTKSFKKSSVLGGAVTDEELTTQQIGRLVGSK